ncbi:MAG TPA: hypothetical protein VHA70_10045 [Bauldia sp.]|nr:hypothetical protein [Bauldia sp.]
MIAKEPRLTDFGLGIYSMSKLSPEEKEAEFEKERAAMYRPEAEAAFEKACEFLAQVDKTESINTKRSSYGLKHTYGNKGENYITNGMFIAAAIHCGFKWKETHSGSPNVSFNMSEKSIKSLTKDRD